jgi:hypothetical protein
VEPGGSSVRPSSQSNSDRVPINSRTLDSVYSVPHLQISGNGLDIFPRPNSPTVKKLMQRQGKWLVWIILYRMLSVCSFVLYSECSGIQS